MDSRQALIELHAFGIGKLSSHAIPIVCGAHRVTPYKKARKPTAAAAVIG